MYTVHSVSSESIATLPPFGPIEGHKWFDQISSQWTAQKNPVCIDLFRQNPVFTSLHLKYPVHALRPLFWTPCIQRDAVPGRISLYLNYGFSMHFPVHCTLYSSARYGENLSLVGRVFTSIKSQLYSGWYQQETTHRGSVLGYLFYGVKLQNFSYSVRVGNLGWKCRCPSTVSRRMPDPQDKHHDRFRN